MLDWSHYDRWFLGRNSQQHPLNESERTVLEAVAADIAGVPAVGRRTIWGRCSPPGRFAATVIWLSEPSSHRFADSAAAHGIDDVGLKLFKTTADATRQGRKTVDFSTSLLPRLPGLPNDHVQRVITAGEWHDCGAARHFVVQEWVQGHTLEELHARTRPSQPPDTRLVRALVEQLFSAIVVPLWSAGTVWWDIRDANFCWNPATERLTMIDVDSLAAYAEEAIAGHRWVRRDKGRSTALRRLRAMTWRILRAQQASCSVTASRFDRAWDDLEPALRTVGKSFDTRPAEAIARFLDRLQAPAGLT